jgi:heavy metal sensor kinase
VTRWTIGTRLTVWYLALMVPATLALAGGSWLLMRHSLRLAADRHLQTRVASAHRLIRGMEHELSVEEIRDEFHEYSELTLGDGLIEVRETAGPMLCQPPIAGWTAMRAAVELPPIDAAPVLADRMLDGSPVRVVASVTRLGARTYAVVAAWPMGPTDDALRRFAGVLAVLAPAILVVAGVGGWWISRRALAPVDHLTREVQALTVRSLDRRLEVPAAHDEVQRLALTFNDMLARLEAGVSDMARFTSDAAHELRTPVTLVRTTADVALARERSAAEYRHALGDVQALAEQMSDLVGALLMLARADAGVEPHEASTIDVRALAAGVVRAASRAADARGVALRLIGPEEAVTAMGDPASLRRLLMILVDNAVTYTPGGPAAIVSVAVEPTGDALIIEVTDTGPGIPPPERSRVFDRFYRGQDARQVFADGAGLGRSIAQAIVARRGGTIEIRSGDDGRGCRVHVTLPAEKAFTTRDMKITKIQSG